MTRIKRAGYIIAWLSILINTVLFGLKYWAGNESESIAMTADAWHSLSDSLTSFIVIIGFTMASRPPDKKHPFGHGRYESVAAIIIATLLGIVAIQFFIDSINSLIDQKSSIFNLPSIIIFAVSIFLKELMALISIRIGKKLDSKALIADGWHHRSDAVASALIVIGALFTSIWWLDGVLGILVSVLIMLTTIEILKGSVSSILGEIPDKEFIEKVKAIIHDVDPQITDIHHFKLHLYGDHRELDIDFRLPKEMSVDKAHDISTAASIALLEKLKIRATIHVEPEES